MEDKILVCQDCQEEFTFTEGEQDFYGEKEWDDPIRCPQCRRERKQKRNNY